MVDGACAKVLFRCQFASEERSLRAKAKPRKARKAARGKPATQTTRRDAEDALPLDTGTHTQRIPFLFHCLPSFPPLSKPPLRLESQARAEPRRTRTGKKQGPSVLPLSFSTPFEARACLTSASKRPRWTVDWPWMPMATRTGRLPASGACATQAAAPRQRRRRHRCNNSSNSSNT